MAILLQARSLDHWVGDRQLFAGIDLNVDEGDRIGLVGHNGCGKSTLLGLLAGDVEPERGEVVRRRGLRLGRVEQFLPASVADLPCVDAVAHADPAGIDSWQVEALLAGLGLAGDVLGRRAGDLSGGQQNRLMFARAVIAEPDLLLLDEPSNHLDLATLRVFERYLETTRLSYVVVSHDRAFLDTVTQDTVFLRDQRLYRFALPYSAARQALDEADDAALRSREGEQRKIEGLRTSAKRLATWGRVYDNEKFARRARNIDRRADRMESEMTFVTRGSGLELDLDVADMRGKEILRIEDLSVEVAGQRLFGIDRLLIRPGERVALLGLNGTGKSTFIRALVEVFRCEASATALLDSGDEMIRFGPQVAMGYYDQELAEATGPVNLREFVARAGGTTEHQATGRLIKAGFVYRDHDKQVSTLSGGERARALFVVLGLQRPNFLILDEPTNHLDLEGKEQLEAQLLESEAAVLVTAHDRRFIDTVAQRFVCIEGGRLRELNDAAVFYATPEPLLEKPPGKEGSTVIPSLAGDDQQDVLDRISELEDKLSQDQARKPKFQKPARQAAWSAELETLYARLDQVTGQ